MAIMAYRIAEHPSVSTPFMVNLDGFNLTHTYENVDIPDQGSVDAFLPPYETDNKIDLENPVNMGYSAGPAYNTLYKKGEHVGMLNARDVIVSAEDEFWHIFGRRYTGLVEGYRTEDADYVVVTLGCISGLCMDVVDDLREEGISAGVLRIRYMRPFPDREVVSALCGAKAVCVLEKDISFGNAGVVFNEVRSSLYGSGCTASICNRIGGLGGRDISYGDIRTIFSELKEHPTDVRFIGGPVQ
jgi:pyruvate ferredoxin oxidoreductase alpha subunit